MTRMDKKIIFFDIDGTLLDEDKNLPESTKLAIAELKRKGHQVAIATGRAPFMFKELRELLDIHSYVSQNGQLVVSEGEVIYANPLRRDLLEALTEYAVAHDHPLVYSGAEDMKASMDKHIDVESSMGTLKLALPSYDPDYYRTRDIYQSIVFCTEEAEEAYRQAFPELKFVRWHPVSMDVLPSNGSKANGIAQMIDILGYRREDIYAFGDQLNDLEMLEFAGHSVAMGNAPDSVKQAARYVTRHVNEDGILFGLQKVGLL